MKVGIINSGGDTQGMNAVIASAVVYGLSKGMSFIGFYKGWEGLLDKDFVNLDREVVRGISHLGGTILSSTNKGRFAGRKGEGELNRIPEEIINLAIDNMKELELDALLVIGGDGTLSAAMQLAEKGVKLVGVPKTIDNDFNKTDSTFGFNTAVDVVMEALDRIHTTAVSHNRVFFVETMGRNAGWIALSSGLAGGASAILIPEVGVDINKLVEFLRYRIRRDRNGFAIVVVSEGVKINNEVTQQSTNDKPEVRLGGISNQLMHKVEEVAPKEFDMRNIILGHIQRGGSPNAQDRILSKRFGTAAIDAMLNNNFGKVVCLQGSKIVEEDIIEATKNIKKVNADNDLLQVARNLGIFVGE